jgi:hypothetical protein
MKRKIVLPRRPHNIPLSYNGGTKGSSLSAHSTKIVTASTTQEQKLAKLK